MPSPAAARALANEKQDKLTGTVGQLVGFDERGNAIPQNAPQSGMTQTQSRRGIYSCLAKGSTRGCRFLMVLLLLRMHSFTPYSIQRRGSA